MPLRCLLTAFLLTAVAGLTGGGFAADDPTQQEREQKSKSDAEGFERIVRPFLEAHCAECHEGETVKGQFDLARDARNDFSDDAMAGHWRKMAELVRNGEMPPAKEPRPEAGRRRLSMSG